MLSRKRYALLAITTVVLSTLATAAVFLGVDLYLHKRYERRWGLNVWGYRGPVVGRKRAGEARIVVLGGSTALGFGVPPDQSFPAHLERKLQPAIGGPRGPGSVSVVNLAYNNEGAYSFTYTLADYEYLDYDVVLFYTGVNDVGHPNRQVFRHDSAIFRRTGYYFMLPTFLRDRAAYIRYGGDLEAANRGEKTAFRPDLGQRATAAMLDAAASVSRALERQLAGLERESAAPDVVHGAECTARWRFYCDALFRAVDGALAHDRKVVVVSEPYLSAIHVEQQHTMTGALQARFSGHRRFWYLDFGHAVDVRNPALAFDGMHLTEAGNESIAGQLVEPLVQVLAGRQR